MSDHILKTLDDVNSDIAKLEAQLLEKKIMANSLAGMAGKESMYDVTTETSINPQKSSLRGDEFVSGKASTAFQKALKYNDAPMSVPELYDLLIAGGYKFETNNVPNLSLIHI